MSQNEIKQQIAQYLGSHPFINLATVTAEGAPLAHTVAFVADGATLFFTTRKDTRKAANMQANPKVAYTVDQDQYAGFAEITGVQMEGTATVISDPQEIAAANQLYRAKFGEAATITPSDMHIVVKIAPVRAYFLNYAKGFDHKDLVEY
ncbi:MAG: pyridoxamine 5'-phosphate oxidase family protein [Desulfarculus sp.]|nr:pyridoxamine 5'-phosphate oxidase family protein [Pseudomonadota bacterium]MBV1715062.1 pyridoxamine 5'-phosphate oxidase family protein [Desulfarculus sp.]MBU4576037.1 pyridoxamine 5'-phosphate oxidase family protein [Pseudomonadota bacterium]MBU4599665.1 pyridoxamine 5'-phosphate oxidase family protein [Pseudomonadota bacterium]MBV1739894.1 pyridoxamine 5'-phosphate oxidase family protein [Desulfarculus sp.]